MKLHVHADDFGINESVSLCIAECFDRGWINETSLMVNMPYADKAVALAKEKGFANKVGLHLNLTLGTPLTDEIKHISLFCNPDGTFNRRFRRNTFSRFFITAREKNALGKEILAQIEKFRSYGNLFNKIDSHHHVHTDWSIYRVLKPLAIGHGFKAMRISADLHRVRFDKETYKQILNRDMRQHFVTTTHFGSVNEVLPGLSGSIEVMVHPCMKDGILCDTDVPYVEQFEKLKVIHDAHICAV